MKPKAMLNKSVRVELVETQPLQIRDLQKASTGSARTEVLVQRSPNGMVSKANANKIQRFAIFMAFVDGSNAACLGR
jgi:hypothetical protein